VYDSPASSPRLSAFSPRHHTPVKEDDFEWEITPLQRLKWSALFEELDKDKKGYILGI
jgi:hypothetical protein